MNELQKSMNGIKASEKLKADTLRYLEEQREVKAERRTRLGTELTFGALPLRWSV